ncbi:MAG: hypothetical protein WA918_06015 [Erythrobacter sp.]
MVEWATHRQPPFTGEVAEEFKDAITAAHLVADEGRLDLQRWVDAARRSGLSWTDIGDALGISKQAAQQRFRLDHSDDEVSRVEGEKVVRPGAHAFNEMRILAQEGENGHELIDAGLLKLIFRKTDHQWEYRRRIGGVWMADEMRAEMKKAGWTYVSSWPPFHYFKRRLSAQ